MKIHQQPTHLSKFRLLTLVDFDKLFRSNPEAILLDRLNYADPDYATKLKSRVYTRAGELSFFASCGCDHPISGNFYLGQKCPNCGNIVKNDFTIGARIPNETWLSFPETIPGVLHPIAYLVLSEWLRYKGKPAPIDDQLKRKGKPNYIDVIINPKLDMPPELQGVVLGRGHQYFYDNFDMLMKHFLTEHKTKCKHKSTPFIKLFIQKYRPLLFCHYVPILSSILHTITTESSSSARALVDRSPQHMMDAAIDLSQLRYAASRHRSTVEVEDLIHKCYKKYIAYLEDIEHSLGAKKGLIRLHMFGARFDWSFRTVIIPITTPHHYDEIHIPWCVVVNMLKIHIIGQLTQAGMSMEHAAEKQSRAVIIYDPDVDVIIKRLIAEHPESGLPCMINRNPSLDNICVYGALRRKVQHEGFRFEIATTSQ